jgi:hypothetical protein
VGCKQSGIGHKLRYRLWAVMVLGTVSIPMALWAEGRGPKSIVFETRLGSVTFPHDNHGQYVNGDCAKCHHVKDGKNKACRACHKRRPETTEGDPISFYDVKMGFCRDCHREQRAAKEASKAPVLCKECHNVKEIRYSN